jgi:hypothetical protein
MTSRRSLARAAAARFSFAGILSLSFFFSLSLLAADGLTLTGLTPPHGQVKGPVGTIVNGNFTGPMLDGQNSVEAKFHYELDSAPTGQVYVGVWDQPLLPRRLLGAQNINKGTGDVSIRFSLACTPGAPGATDVHTIEFGINRFNPPPTTAALPKIHHEKSVRYTFTCPPPTAPKPSGPVSPR